MASDIGTVNRTTGEVVPHQSGASFAIDGSMPLGIEDLRPPILKIVQGQTRNVDPKKIGQYHLSLDGSYHEEFGAVFVGLTNKSRALRRKIEDGGSLDEPPLCASDDAIVPRSQEQALAVGAGAVCGTCPFSRFGPNNEAPACAEQWNFLGLTYEDEPMPFLFRVQGLAIRPAKQFIQQFYWKKHPLYTAVTTLSTQLKTGDRGNAYIPVFHPQPLDPSESAQFAEAARSFAGFRAQADTEADAAEAPSSHNRVMNEAELSAVMDSMEAPEPGPESQPEQGELIGSVSDEEYGAFKQRLGYTDPVDAPKRRR